MYSAIGGLILLLAYKFKSGRNGTDKLIKSTEPANSDASSTTTTTVETLEPLDGTGGIKPARDTFMLEPMPDKTISVDNWDGSLAVNTR